MGFFSSLSFLTPLYVAAGLAVGLPILFHLIRRTPRGRQDFSSLMFLSPSPPRITRRSRIENWLLLLLRALAVLLIAAAFCRPLWRQLESGAADQVGRRMVVLLDASASMQRAGLRDEAVREISDRVADLSPDDELTLLAFDDRVQPILDRQEWRELDPAQRAAVVRARLEEWRPGWGASHLDRALLAAADQLEQADASGGEQRSRTVVVVSDLQEGLRWQGLQGFEWPQGVEVELVRLGEELSGANAGVQVVGRPEIGEESFVRVRVTNAANSRREQFQVGWRDVFGADPAAAPSGAVSVYVPPGQSRVVRLPSRGDGPAPTRVLLAGDDHPFDNTCSISWPERRNVRIAWIGPDDAADREGLRYFLSPLFPSTQERTISIIDWDAGAEGGAGSGPAGANDTADSSPSLVIASGSITAADAAALRRWIQEGGALLYVCRDAQSSASLFELAGLSPQPVTEAAIEEYAMLREVDFSHPMFQMLDDPRYSDLTKVHFWRHRVIDEEALPESRVIARFDNDAPALLELDVGSGRLLVLTSGWSRDDSELATWSKFVPIMNALLETTQRRRGETSQTFVGDPLPLDALREGAVSPESIETPDGARLDWTNVSAGYAARLPGLYRVHGAPQPDGSASVLATMAVNVPADESRTAPLGADVLDALGVRLAGERSSRADAGPMPEQLARAELESRQKLWRWLLGAALVVLLLETLLAARPDVRAEPTAS